MQSDTIYVHDEGDEVIYGFEGADAAAREEKWAQTGEPTYDTVTPAAGLEA